MLNKRVVNSRIELSLKGVVFRVTECRVTYTVLTSLEMSRVYLNCVSVSVQGSCDTCQGPVS